MTLSNACVSEIQGIFHMRQNIGHIKRLVNRRGYGLIFMEYGVLRFTSDQGSYVLDNQHVLIIPKNVSYDLSCEENCCHYSLNFDVLNPECMPDSFQMVAADVSKTFASFLCKINKFWEVRNESSALICFSLLYEIMAHINTISNKSYHPIDRFESIAKSVEYLETHYTDPMISNETVAAQSGISTVYFRKLFTACYGTSPMHYVREKRIARAKELLEFGFISIGELAEQVGFNSIYHFSKTFKQLTGMSPTAYVASYNREQEAMLKSI